MYYDLFDHATKTASTINYLQSRLEVIQGRCS